MNRLMSLVKKIAKKNILVRVIMMIYYAVFFFLRNLSRYLLIQNKKTVACILVVTLLIPRMFMGIANAEAAELTLSVGDVQVSGNNILRQVSGGDDSGQVSGGDDLGHVSGGDSSGQVSGGDVEQIPEEMPEQTPDEIPEEIPDYAPEQPDADANVESVHVQQIEVIYDNMRSIGEMHVGSPRSCLTIRPITIGDMDKNQVNPLVDLYYGYDGQEYHVDCTKEGISISIPYEYFGNFYCYGVDAKGNYSNKVSTQLLIDSTAPVISWEIMKVNDVRYLRIIVQEEGEALSGIDFSGGFIYGVSAEKIAIVEEEITENFFGQAVISRVIMDISLEDLDESSIELSFSDYVGNFSTDMLELPETVEESQILTVEIPSEIYFTIMPGKSDKQIVSEPLTIVNHSECDIYFKLKNVNISVNRNNVNENPELKRCDMYLETDEANRYFLPEGDSGELCVVRIPGRKSGDGNNTFTFYVDGYVDSASNKLWRDGDVSISILVSFWGIKENGTELETLERK